MGFFRALFRRKKAEPLENMRLIGSSGYVVWTQAGFKQAIHSLHRIHEDDNPVEGYPTQYPSIVEFQPGYHGYHYWHAQCTPLSQAIKSARNKLQALLDIDAEHRAAVKRGRAAR